MNNFKLIVKRENVVLEEKTFSSKKECEYYFLDKVKPYTDDFVEFEINSRSTDKRLNMPFEEQEAHKFWI